ncbi:hypothetical protein [Bradyrhizobium sp. HKCCYLS2033]|uniref:hypothetical protein n=1 Tax=Bradyrhizobium sp. HKCCYLS2033 TaxID=3420739 RepID=UPI003EB93305
MSSFASSLSLAPRQTNLLRDVGERLYGASWQAQLSATLGVSERSLRRWLAGTDRVPRGVWAELKIAVASHWINVRELEYQINDLMRVAVYSFKRWNQQVGDFDVSPLKATRDYIDKVGCEIVESSELKVDAWDVDDEGRYRPAGAADRLSVSDVMQTTNGSGFNVLDQYGAPQATVEYADRETAIHMRSLLHEAVSRSTSITVHRR